jgi:hypothetical protein
MLLALVFFGPRGLMFFWWLIDPVRWNLTFNTVIWPLVGFVFAPWTTLAYLAVAPGGISLGGWLFISLAFLIDLASYGGAGVGMRRRSTAGAY